MPDLGTKHECTSCAAKFYDLGKAEPICPKCGLNQLAEEEPEPAEEEPEADAAGEVSGGAAGEGDDGDAETAAKEPDK